MTPSTNTMSDFDFDANGNIWATGNAGNLYRFRPDKSVKIFPFTGGFSNVNTFTFKFSF